MNESNEGNESNDIVNGRLTVSFTPLLLLTSCLHRVVTQITPPLKAHG